MENERGRGVSVLWPDPFFWTGSSRKTGYRENSQLPWSQCLCSQHCTFIQMSSLERYRHRWDNWPHCNICEDPITISTLVSHLLCQGLGYEYFQGVDSPRARATAGSNHVVCAFTCHIANDPATQVPQQQCTNRIDSSSNRKSDPVDGTVSYA